ncbi:phosphohistidine phosphatase [Geomonas limicola]|uniref:Phosphohistidine phosphatase n=1 Tax=Geomonas limicola TaxID=2740186 RepID=A0A6V8NAW9_9BACT|nr:histidine phosphatase family protein [Geomonas limicola]GFO69772.1 phosphohistidine phosphatase [Geomonas limicola]
MVIHLVRHAEAIERTPEVQEQHRYLTPRGRVRFRKIARTLKISGIDPDLILTSPLIRAVQTAEILAQTLKFKKELQLTDLLAHGFGAPQLRRLLEEHPDAREIALVGHEPELGEVTRVLLDTDTPCALDKGATVTFKLTAQGEAAFRQFVDGKGNLFDSRNKALKHLNQE